MKKKILLLVIVMTILSACGPNTWVLEKERLNEVRDIENYVELLQTEHTEFRGYRVFTISEGKKMEVASSGSNDTTLEFSEAGYSTNNTTISVDEISKNSNEENPYIIVGIGEIKGDLTVVNENEDEFNVFEFEG